MTGQTVMAPVPHNPVRHMYGTAASHTAFCVFFAVFAAGAAGVAFLALRLERRARVFHSLAGVTLAITATAYLLLATGIGLNHAPYHITHDHEHYLLSGVPPPHPGYPREPTISRLHRQHIWVRDFSHVLTAPLLVLQLAVLSGMAPLTGILAALASSAAAFSAAIANNTSHYIGYMKNDVKHLKRFQYRWIVWMVIAVLWTGVVFGYLLLSGRTASRYRSAKTRSRFFLLTALLLVGYVTYGVLSVLGSGAYITSIDVDVIVLGIMDVAAQVGFVYFLLLTHVHDDQDPSWEFPEWFAQPRFSTDNRGTYARVAAEPTPAEAADATSGN